MTEEQREPRGAELKNAVGRPRRRRTSKRLVGYFHEGQVPSHAARRELRAAMKALRIDRGVLIVGGPDHLPDASDDGEVRTVSVHEWLSSRTATGGAHAL